HKNKAASFLVEGGPQGTAITRGEGPARATIEAKFDTVLRLITRAAASAPSPFDGTSRRHVPCARSAG
ncbi:MAG: hypothetical protein ABI824_14770, partial [Acidobacteriota bacterium]